MQASGYAGGHDYSEKRKWILYPFSIFHAKVIGGIVHGRFINNPAAKYHNLII